MATNQNGEDLKSRVAAHLAQDPRAMTPIMAREFGVPEVEIIRALPTDQSTELRIGENRTLELLHSLERLGRVHVIASNEGCTLEAYGHFGEFSVTGPFFNVQTKTLDMHIKYRELTAAFAVIKPSHQDGQTTYSIQFFTKSGAAAFKVFLYKSVTEADGGEITRSIAEWQAIREAHQP